MEPQQNQQNLVHINNFGNNTCKGQVMYNPESRVFTLTGSCSGPMRYLAAAPPDLRQSRAGSGLPWPNEQMAYDQTPNTGRLTAEEAKNFVIKLYQPNCYYVNGGSTMVKPHVHIFVNESQLLDVKLGECPVANRSLKHLPGRARRSYGAGLASTGGH
mgnify:CR=1 FL=1